MSNRNEPQFKGCELDLLDPEINRGIVYTITPDVSHETLDACKKIARIGTQMEKPLHRPCNVVQDDLSSERSPETSSTEVIASSDMAQPKEKSRLKRPRKASRKRRSRAKLRRRVSPVEPDSDDLAHEARCSICRSDCHADIDEEFTHWHSPENIAYDYKISMRSLYRHARHKNLFVIRDRNLRYALGHVIDRVERIPVMTPEAIIRAVHAFARINNEGQWVEPPKHVIFSTTPSVAAQPTQPFNIAVSVPRDSRPPSIATVDSAAQLPEEAPHLLLPAPSDSASLQP